MLTAVVVLLRSISLICCGHQAVALENSRFVSSWPPGSAPANARSFARATDSSGSCSLTLGGTGGAPWSSSNRTPWCGGLVTGFGAAGPTLPTNRSSTRRSADSHPRQPDGGDQPALGSTADSRRIADARDRGVGTRDTIHSRYAIVDNAMLTEAAAKL